ncbi:MAG: TlpA family protein disulfide reductase [Calditrichaeota bacterium]|nr:TlpA family protein disulfide reductase [Calditrichota bacterium]
MRKQLIAVLTLFFLFTLYPKFGYLQTIHVVLDELCILSSNGIHITLFNSSPKVELQLPEIDISKAKFFDLFYTWDIKDDPNVNAMMVTQKNADELYIDLNNDKDLTNDGSPIIFKHSQNSIHFDIISAYDANQKTRLVLQRKPVLSDTSLVSHFVDNEGNLKEKLAQMWGAMKGNFDYKGKAGTFYFDERMCLRKGLMSIDKSIFIGLYDYTNNGLFNDKEDCIIIDLNHDGKMGYDDENEIFKLNDIFTIQSKNYKIVQLDKYGRWIDIQKTDEEATFYYLQERQEIDANFAKNKSIQAELDSSFWKLEFKSITNETIKMKDYQNMYLVVNFWGEWCKPCIDEIPDLIEIDKNYTDKKLQIISFLKTNNLTKAKKIIDDKAIDWPQIMLSEDIISQFKIKSYPTNILLFPHGIKYIKTNQINIRFIQDFLNHN